jgi:cytochrome c oxidase subunit 1
VKNKSLNINIPTGKIGSITKYWLVLAISALAAAGLFSLPPVILRGPFFADKLPVELIFATALVVHVDLSVIVWFLSISGFFWSLLADEKNYLLYKTSLILAALGTLLLILSPFIGDPAPLKNNYIPMLQNFTFVMGLSFFACGVLFQVCLTLTEYKKALYSPLNFGIYAAAAITAIAAVCFVLEYNTTALPTDSDFLPYYEALFWGGGHILQFTFTTVMLLAWLWVSTICGVKLPLPNKAVIALLALNVLIILPSPLFYLTDNSRYFFSEQMKNFAGISPLIIGGSILCGFFFSKKNESSTPHLIKASLILSILLFGYGGVLGHMISGVNVTIPAHYHGSIVAVTLAFMAVSYYLLPQFGYGQIKGKLATSQPYIYGVGQMMHITGLAWMGGYGALRKAAASSQNIDTVAGKALFFSGGAFAITGGLIFVIVAVRAILKRAKPA